VFCPARATSKSPGHRPGTINPYSICVLPCKGNLQKPRATPWDDQPIFNLCFAQQGQSSKAQGNALGQSTNIQSVSCPARATSKSPGQRPGMINQYSNSVLPCKGNLQKPRGIWGRTPFSHKPRNSVTAGVGSLASILREPLQGSSINLRWGTNPGRCPGMINQYSNSVLPCKGNLVLTSATIARIAIGPNGG
jgi:hypothetical protein